jgi:L-iditol 2-dehydrogenase
VKALRLHGATQLALHEEPDPVADDGELLIRVTAVGLCGSDRHWLIEGGIGDAVLETPLVLGHEFAGVVESGRRAGERVVLDPAIPCGRCPVCRAGQPHLCISLRFAGHGSTDGALRTLMTWPQELAHRVPDALPDDQAPLLEPLGVALHALDLGHVGQGTSTAVVGCGPIGLLLLQAIRAAGASAVLATDRLPHRVESAAAMGADRALAADDPAVETASKEATGGLGVDVAFEAADEDGAVDAAIAATRPGGRVVLVGIPDADRTTFTASIARRKGLTLLLCRRMAPTDLPRAIGLVGSGGVQLDGLVTARFGLGEWREAFAALRDRSGLKVIVEPQRLDEETSG